MSAHVKSSIELALRIRLTKEAERRLTEEATARGVSVSEFLSEMLERAVERRTSFAEVSEPFAAAVSASGLTDAEFDSLVEELRDEVWREQHAK